MALLWFIVGHWYISLFFQSFFHHRYAAHGHFTMSRFWERTFYICCFISQGSSYISATAYGLMHRLHHAHTDTDKDPHSPHFTDNPFALLWMTRNSYNDIYIGKMKPEAKYYRDLPRWDGFDRLFHNWKIRVVWALIYVAIYSVLATEWWMFLFLPVTLAMGALQGLAVNWWAHKFGYEAYKCGNTSRNILPVDLLFVGEAYHNNHHRFPGRANNAVRWYEFDITYRIIQVMDWMQIVRIKRRPAL
jgi:stearoyl-CoA desaturase (Delta-9 desaturase)